MRLIGHLDSDKDARTFGDFLYVQGIETDIDPDGDRWGVWVHAEDQIEKAKSLLAEFRANPADPKYQAGSPAEKLRKQAENDNAAYRKRMIDGRLIMPGARHYGFGAFTYALIAMCVLVVVISKFGSNKEPIAGLFIERFSVDNGYLLFESGLRAVKSGEVWRLVTPIFIHFGIAHIVFNMLMLKDMGSLFEARLGSWYFGLFVLVVAVGSNLAQYLITHRANFGGMSGVVYGLIGYAWIRGRFDPGAGVSMDRQSWIYALVWFVLCFTGLVGPIANWAHAGGLVLGMAWAFVDAKRR